MKHDLPPAALACLPLHGREAHEAARRLRALLPIREHKIGDDMARTGRPKGGTNKRAVTVGGRVFESAAAAARAHGISKTAFGKWLWSGKAEYV